jgi:peptide/nickel transport system substrate-binding protein
VDTAARANPPAPHEEDTMRVWSDHGRLVALLALCAVACQPAAPAPARGPASAPAAAAPVAASSGPTRVTVGVTETIESQAPYLDSTTLGNGIWCEVLGCLMSHDYQTPKNWPGVVERWTVEDPNTWILYLRRNVHWQDGSPLTTADVVHSLNRIATDKDSKQRNRVTRVAGVEALDDYTFRLTTKDPTAWMPDQMINMIITSKAQYDQFGPDAINQQPPLGMGPYTFKELIPNERLVVTKTPNWWGGPVEGPDEVIYRVIRENEVRVTALLNGEIQIAQFIPPHMAGRVSGSPNAKLVTTDSIEIMFLAMMPKTKPWDNKLVRQAVAYAIDRDAVIQGVFQGQARRLDGPVGPGTFGYNPDLPVRYTYDLAKAKQLLAEAGYPNGVDVELSTPVNRYPQDKQATEAMASMLTAAGIRTRLLTPEWPTLWDAVQKGQVPFYYMGRGTVSDPGSPLSQYFETGGSPRIGYSNPQLDALFAKERATFDPAERKQVLTDLFSLLTDEAPAHFLWTNNVHWGMAKNIEYAPRPDTVIYANDIRVR